MTTEHDDGAEQFASFDAFISETIGAPRTETIRGITVNIPRDLSMRFSLRIQSAWDSQDEGDFRALIAELYGSDVLDQWIAAGMGLMELQTLLVWSVAHGSGYPITYQRAYELAREATTEGKALALPAADRSVRRTSGGTGGRSRPTSSGSTATTRSRSRT